ncbi:MAG: non-lysosomal glucosylceramidase [Candidatus Thorarchaeota archaeon]|nr:non-lysosomal glucosylceramidase [Candidatus Thorarchaeota archaeon]
MTEKIPPCTWTRRLDEAPSKPGKSRRYPWRMALRMLPLFLRIKKQAKIAGTGAEPPQGFSVKMIDDGVNQGIPIGGLGAGSIGRTYRGDFARWHLEIGQHIYYPSVPNQFHIRIERDGKIFTQTLNPRPQPPQRLQTWSWGMNPERATYHALFPRAWTEYNFEDHDLRLVCKQLSPVIGGNYQESSYPVGVFHWTMENIGKRPLDISLMLTWENAINPFRRAHPKDYVSGSVSDSRALLELAHARTEEVYPVSFGIGAEGHDSQLSICEQFDTSGHGGEIWFPFESKGFLDDRPYVTFHNDRPFGSAINSKTTILPFEKKEVTFVISWDIPIMRFGQGREWYRRYTRFFDVSGDNAIKIARLALDKWQDWDREITKWQQSIITREWPDWFKTALFNELYYLVDGGTAWEAGSVESGPSKEGIGRFAYLECFDYPFYNTYDVHYYASFALLRNWPELEKSIQRDFTQAVLINDPRERMLLFDGDKAPRKPFGVVPHDLGAPLEDPWHVTNAYNAQDVSRWKDLNTKYVLQVYRDFVITQDKEFLEYCWPSVRVAMEYIDQFDKDDDGLPENEGFPDQTYDVWVMRGASAYCGGLYLAAADAMIEMAKVMGDKETADKYREIYRKGKVSFDEKLWNGEYFNFDSSGGKHSNSIMADMLSGLLYTHASGLERYVDPEKAMKSLRKIFEFNVMQFENGRIGAINGMRPNGSPDRTSIQSSEVWTGTTYALAALMIFEGLRKQAFKTAEGIYNVVYNKSGYWFRTPEAWTHDLRFRASMYMRPLAIWAMELALQMNDPK